MNIQIEIDWNRLEQKSNCKIFFKCKKRKREYILSILKITKKSPICRIILKQLGEEFKIIYERYRRLLKKQKGLTPSYYINDKDFSRCERIAELCFKKNVTPKQVITFWHRKIKHYKSTKLKIVPITFLDSEANIKAVAKSDLHNLEKPPEEIDLPKFGNTYSDVSRLNPKVRIELKKKGFDVNYLSDLYLLTIQEVARAMAEGINIFVSKEIKPMAKHLVQTVYKKLGKDENGTRCN